MSNAMDSKNISNRRCSEELCSFTSCSRRTQVSQRSAAVFDEFCDSVVVLSAAKTSEPQAPKVRRAKKFFDATNSAAAHVYATPKDYLI